MLPATYTLMIKANKNLNPDRNGNPSPVLIRIYKLKNITNFNNSDFFSMHDHDRTILNSDILSTETMMIQPGESKILYGEATQAERHLGIFVAYREIDNSIWRSSLPLPQPRELGRFSIFTPSFAPTVININLGPNKIGVEYNRSN